MNLSIEFLNVLLFLTPGLFATIVLDLVLVRKERDAAQRIIHALILSLIIYGIVSSFGRRFPVAIAMVRDSAGKIVNTTIDVDMGLLIPVIALSIILPLFVGHLLTGTWFMRALRRMRITVRTGRESAWVDVFTDQKRYVIVSLADGRRLFGWPSYFSDDGEEGMLYLSDAVWYDGEGNPQDTGAHGIFLVRKESINLIEFTKTVKRKEGEK